MGSPVQIPGVTLGDELGRGAYSVVHVAYRGDARYALKIPRVRGRWTQWVYREAVALGRVRHPGLPHVVEVGETDGLPYLLMELVDGETLGDRLARGPLPVDQALDHACQLADTLRAVHEVGLVHRDVKPRNVIVDRTGKVRLVDFGFAAPVGSAAGLDVAGTRRYSAPEQFRSPDRVDARADLYALGRVLAECLTGRPCGDVDPVRVVAALASAGIPAGVARIVAGLVAEAPEERYPDAVAVLGELHRVRAGGMPRGAGACEPARVRGALVGRDAELEQFVRAWRDVQALGGRSLFVEGLRGSGKTRFIQTCAAKVQDEGRARTLEWLCREGDPPLAALRGIFDAYLASLPRLPPQERAAATTALRSAASGALASLACVVAPGFVELLGGREPPRAAVPDAFAEGAAELVIRLARLAGPVLLSFDDLQWIDAASQDVLTAVAARAHEAPLLLLAASRPTAEGRAFGRFDGVAPRRSTRITLGPLEMRQSAALIAAHLGVTSADPAVVRRVVTLADDTPVGILEVLGAHLDAGALRLRDDGWQLDDATAERVTLPPGALAFLGRRARDLPPATRRVLEVAAVLGTRFEDTLLADMLALEVQDVAYALADGRRAGLLEAVDARSHAFSHDSVREMLAGALDEASQRRWHQRAAELLLARAPGNVDLLHACAAHFAAGEADRTPALAYRAARGAAESALERFDNETAIRFFEMSRRWAAAAGLDLDASFHRKVGEAQLRVGALEESLRSFESAHGVVGSALERASVLGRISWVQRSRSRPDDAWEALERAFDTLGVKMPTEDAATGPTSGRRRPPQVSSGTADVLYDLYQQHARLGLECGTPRRTLQSTTRILALANDAGPSAALARAHATYGGILVFAGSTTRGERHLEKAHQMARALAEPATMGFCLQRRVAALAVQGEFEAALNVLREYADEYGPWLELAEFCDSVANGCFVETIRGRANHAWAWIARALDRLGRQRHRSPNVATHLLHRARAALASLGRAGQEGTWLAAQVEAAHHRAERTYYRLTSWGPQALYLLESDELGAAFEDLVRRFEAEGHAPSASHPVLLEYYIAVAHARIHLCVRSGAETRGERIVMLRKAAEDLRAAAKLDLYKAHSLLADGYLAWLEGHPARANRLLAKAEALARRETCPWVLSSVARARAHMLREQGRHDAARDQARMAETLARDHGAEPRARVIREEFSLPAPQAIAPAVSSIASSRRSSQRARRHLASLLHVVHGPHDHLPRPQQAAGILDDLVRELGAERAHLIFEPDDDPGGRLALGRTRLGEALPAPEGWRDEIMRGAIARGDDEPEPFDDAPSREGPTDPRRVLTLPLWFRERVVGAVCLERGPSDAAFAPDDLELLVALAHQVPLALELSRLLETRDQLQASAVQAQKMEVVGQLASSVAHDLNNMLGAMRAGFDLLFVSGHMHDRAREDALMIDDALVQAAELVSRLLAISRQKPVSLKATDLNASITTLQRLLRGVSSKWIAPIQVDLRLDPDAGHGLCDQASLDQALLNLAVNARDAMPKGGTLTVATRSAVLGEDAVRRGARAAGAYVVIDVSDTGDGIPPDVLPRVFDPFFTTKGEGKGTGLGLTSVYRFVQNCGGHVEVSSEQGRGTTFRLYFPKAEPVRSEPRPSPPPAPSEERPVKPAMILVVDDDRNIREVTRELLADVGYRVQTASGSAEALRVMQTQGDDIALVILDVNMPGMNGRELDRRLADLHVPAKVLFVTGYGPDDVPGGASRFLQKPYSRADLLGRVQTLLSA